MFVHAKLHTELQWVVHTQVSNACQIGRLASSQTGGPLPSG